MLPAVLAGAGIAAYLMKKRKEMKSFGNALPDYEIALEPGYSYFGDERWPYGHSSSYLKLSPEFSWHEKPIPPHSDYTDMAPGLDSGTVQSDPYKKIDYVYDTGVDYYRSKMPYYKVHDQTHQDNSMGGRFVGPNTNAFSTMITNTADRISSFIRG